MAAVHREEEHADSMKWMVNDQNTIIFGD